MRDGADVGDVDGTCVGVDVGDALCGAVGMFAGTGKNREGYGVYGPLVGR